MDHLKGMAKKDPSKTSLIDHWKSLPRGDAKLDFALKLKVDREACFMTLSETHETGIQKKARVMRTNWPRRRACITTWITQCNNRSSKTSWKDCPAGLMREVIWLPKCGSNMATPRRWCRWTSTARPLCH
jgi:hypothetical protein